MLSSKASRKETKAAARRAEDAARTASRARMHREAQETALDAFATLMAGGALFPARLPVAVLLRLPLWDTSRLAEDALALLARFPPAPQYGDLHGGAWRTLCLRSAGGALDDDSPAPLDCYAETPAWAASTYIVPCVLAALTGVLGTSPCNPSPLQRVRLSVLPPGANVAWHTDYEDTRDAGPARLHIPLLCSDSFTLNIGGR